MGIRRDTVLRRLKSARELVNSKKTWTKSHNAIDAEGEEVLVSSDRAVRFCATGAVERVTLKDRARTEEADYNVGQGALGAHANAIIKRLYQNLPKASRRSDSYLGGSLESSTEIDMMVDDLQVLNDGISPHSRRRMVGVFSRAIKELEAELDE